MSRTIAQRDLRNQNAQIMAAVQAGESFVVTRNGEPIAELVPLQHPRRQRLVPKAQIQALAARGPRVDAETFRRDRDTAMDQRLARG